MAGQHDIIGVKKHHILRVDNLKSTVTGGCSAGAALMQKTPIDIAVSVKPLFHSISRRISRVIVYHNQSVITDRLLRSHLIETAHNQFLTIIDRDDDSSDFECHISLNGCPWPHIVRPFHINLSCVRIFINFVEPRSHRHLT